MIGLVTKIYQTGFDTFGFDVRLEGAMKPLFHSSPVKEVRRADLDVAIVEEKNRFINKETTSGI